MLNKMKECVGWDGNSHPAFIYKNIKGEKYCKQCTYKLQAPKPIQKRSEKGKEKLKEKIEATKEQSEFFIKIWEARKHIDYETGEIILGEPRSYHFHHILEKGISKYEKYRYCDWNIVLVNWDTHQQIHSNIDKTPRIKALTKELEDKDKLGLLNE